LRTLLTFALEFGTVPVDDVLLAIIIDAIAMSNNSDNKRLKDEARDMMREAFFCLHTQGWADSIVERTQDVFRSSLKVLDATLG